MIAQPEWNWAKSQTRAMDMEGMHVTGVTGSTLNLGETEPAMLEIIDTQIVPKLYKVTLSCFNHCHSKFVFEKNEHIFIIYISFLIEIVTEVCTMTRLCCIISVMAADVLVKQTHDDIIKWKHYPCYWPFVLGIHRSQRPVTRDFDVFSDLRLNKLLSKQWWGWWFGTPSRPLWHHCNKLGHQRPWCRPNSRAISAWASEMWNIISLSIAYFGNPVYFKMPPLDSRAFLEDLFCFVWSLREIHHVTRNYLSHFTIMGRQYMSLWLWKKLGVIRIVG